MGQRGGEDTPEGSKSSRTGQVTSELPSTSIHAYVRTMAPVKNGASVSPSSSERTRPERTRASA